MSSPISDSALIRSQSSSHSSSQSTMGDDQDGSAVHDTWLAAERQFSMTTDVPVPTLKRPPSPAGKNPISPTTASFVLFPHQVGSKSTKSLPPPSFRYDYSLPSVPPSPAHRRTPHVASLQPARLWSRLASDTWTIELLAAFVSCASIVSIVGILGTYDQKPLPELTTGITVSQEPINIWSALTAIV